MTFDTFVQGIAREFIQSVMVVDDRASLGAPVEPEPIRSVTTPRTRGMSKSAGDDYGGDLLHPKTSPFTSGDLDGVELTRGFATLGVSCSIYKPMPGVAVAEDTSNTARIARHADVVVLDWHIGTDPSQARSIFRRIVDEDKAQNGRLRLIAFYTSEPNLAVIASDIKGDLNDLGLEVAAVGLEPEAWASERTMLRWRASAAVFVQKEAGNDPLGAVGVNERDLPLLLVKDFAILSRGVVPAVALAAITSVRNSTHHVLARFHNGLDPGLATHRALLKDPKDAETFIAELVADELKSVIEGMEIGPKNSGIDVLRLWLQALAEQGHIFRADPKKGALTPKDAMRLLNEGVSSHGVLAVACMPQYPIKEFSKQISNFFSPSPKEALQTNYELARLSLFEREAHSNSWLPEAWRPTLTLGSVVACEGKADHAFVCVQPSCDAVRIEGARRFAFVPLERSENGKLVVRFADKEDVRLAASNRSYDLTHFLFSGESATGTVIAETHEDGRYFVAATGERFEWLADMRRLGASRLVQQWASQADRIGLDQFEWLRIATK